MVSAFLRQKCLSLSTRGNYEILSLGACCWNTTTATSRVRKSINKQSTTLLSYYLFMASQINALKCQRNQFGCLKEKNIVSVLVFLFLFVSQHIFSTFLCQDLKLNNLFMFWCNIFYTHSRPYGTVAGTGSSPPKTLNWISRSKWTDAYFTVQTSLLGGRLCLFQQDNATQFTILQVLLHRGFTVKVWVLRWPTLLESNKEELSFVAV